MVNYGKGKVYKIWSPNGDKIYIGSTTKEHLSQRMVHHRSCYKLKKKDTMSFIVFEEYGIENCKIELLEAKECISKDELLQLEGKYIRELNCVNKIISGRTQQEYRETHKDEMKIFQQKYREEHAEEIKIYRQEYQEKNKENLLNKKKEYYLKNKEEISKKKKQHYLDNKNK